MATARFHGLESLLADGHFRLLSMRIVAEYDTVKKSYNNIMLFHSFEFIDMSLDFSRTILDHMWNVLWWTVLQSISYQKTLTQFAKSIGNVGRNWPNIRQDQ